MFVNFSNGALNNYAGVSLVPGVLLLCSVGAYTQSLPSLQFLRIHLHSVCQMCLEIPDKTVHLVAML